MTAAGRRNDFPAQLSCSTVISAGNHEIRFRQDGRVDVLRLLIDLHIAGQRQGPGDAAQQRRAIELSGLLARQGPMVVGRGTSGGLRCTCGRETPASGQRTPAQHERC
jgi:hypothetical protein